MKPIEARRLLRTKISHSFGAFDMYGLGVLIPEAIHVCIEAAEEFHKNMEDQDHDDIPVQVPEVPAGPGGETADVIASCAGLSDLQNTCD
jgi:hypothetical protein